MKRIPMFLMVIFVSLGLGLYTAGVFAQEQSGQQEHPTKKEKQEHPTKSEEHPASSQEHPSEHPSKEGTPITVEALAKAIENYVKQEAAKHDGYFVFVDPQEQKELRLTLVKVHKERLSHLGDDVYFACADFKSPDGVMYDLDIFMKGKTAEDLTFTKVMLHKVNGVPRYTWYEENGVWKQKPVKQ